MARRIRFIPANSLVEITCRTVQGRLLLRPSPHLRELTLGVLGRAARLYPVEIHAFAFLSNHYHLLLTTPDAQRLASFMTYLNSNLAREAGRLIRWREKFWGRRYQAVLVSSEVEAQIERLRYILSHGSKEGLVRSPSEWPGAHCARALAEGIPVRGRWVDRTLEYQSRRKGILLTADEVSQVEQLALGQLPALRELPSATYRREIGLLIRKIEEEADQRQELSGRSPAGHQAVLAQDPRMQPNRIRRGPAPLVHAFSGAIRHDVYTAYRRFVDAYRHAAIRLRAGDLLVEFPIGAFPPALPFQALAQPG